MQPTALTGQTLRVNTLLMKGAMCVLSSPRQGEEGASRRIAENIEACATQYGVPFTRFLIESPQDLIDVLAALINSASSTQAPILHLDSHGSIDLGMEIGKSGERVSWTELANLTRPLNRLCNNRLLVVTTMCWGMAALKALEQEDLTPFNVLVAPEGLTLEGEIEDGVFEFYQRLFSANDPRLEPKILGPNYETYDSQRIFIEAMLAYYRKSCQGKGRRLRQEKLLTRLLEQDTISNTKSIRKHLRRDIKATLMLTQKHLDYCAIKFLGHTVSELTPGMVIALAGKKTFRWRQGMR